MNSLKVKNILQLSFKNDRKYQEDCLKVDEEKNIFVVSDGFGGPVSGVKASSDACKSIIDFVYHEMGDSEATLPFVYKKYLSLQGNLIFNALVYANTNILKYNNEKNIHEKGGSSVLAGYIYNNVLTLSNIGSCEAYLIRDGKFRQLIIPKSYSVFESPVSSDLRPFSDIPLMALGMMDDIEPEIIELRVKENDVLLFSTDGLRKHIDQVCEFISKNNNFDNEFINDLKENIKNYRISDNVTMVMVKLWRLFF